MWDWPSKRNEESLKSSFFLAVFFFSMIGGAIDQSINMTIFVYVPAQQFFFEIAWRMDFFESYSGDYISVNT